MAKRDKKSQEDAPPAVAAPAPHRAVATGGAPAVAVEAEAAMTLAEWLQVRVRKPGIAGFAVRARGEQPSRRTAAEWQAAFEAHMKRPTR